MDSRKVTNLVQTQTEMMRFEEAARRDFERDAQATPLNFASIVKTLIHYYDQQKDADASKQEAKRKKLADLFVDIFREKAQKDFLDAIASNIHKENIRRLEQIGINYHADQPIDINFVKQIMDQLQNPSHQSVERSSTTAALQGLDIPANTVANNVESKASSTNSNIDKPNNKFRSNVLQVMREIKEKLAKNNPKYKLISQCENSLLHNADISEKYIREVFKLFVDIALQRRKTGFSDKSDTGIELFKILRNLSANREHDFLWKVGITLGAVYDYDDLIKYSGKEKEHFHSKNYKDNLSDIERRLDNAKTLPSRLKEAYQLAGLPEKKAKEPQVNSDNEATPRPGRR
jgi:hypothetical protein